MPSITPSIPFRIGDHIRYIREDSAWPVGTLGVVTDIDPSRRGPTGNLSPVRIRCEIEDRWGRNNLWSRLNSFELASRMPTQEETAALLDTIKELTA